jgi:hypothetical protein
MRRIDVRTSVPSAPAAGTTLRRDLVMRIVPAPVTAVASAAALKE